MSLFSLSRLRSALNLGVETNEILSERLPLHEPESLRSEVMDYAVQFWFANRRSDGPPEWSCFKPEQHPKLLTNIILYERLDGARYMTRLVGDAIVGYLPVKPVGHFLDEVIPDDRRADVLMRLDRTFEDGLPNYVEKAKVWRNGDASFDYNALSLPFISRETGAERVLCILEFNTKRLNS